MSGLQLGDGPILETDPKPNNVTLGGPGPLSESQHSPAQLPMSSTPNKPPPPPQSYKTAQMSQLLRAVSNSAALSTLPMTALRPFRDLRVL